MALPTAAVAQARAILDGYAGSEEGAIALLRHRLPDAIPQWQAEPESALQPGAPFDVTVQRYVTTETINDTDSQVQHAAWGVVLEPETPYGLHGVWFSPSTIRVLAASPPATVEALNHRHAVDGLTILQSFIDEDGSHAKPGSWIIGCALSPEVYEAINAGAYTGFSIKGLATLAPITPQEAANA
jgi:hypothetical protein